MGIYPRQPEGEHGFSVSLRPETLAMEYISSFSVGMCEGIMALNWMNNSINIIG